MQAQDGWGRNTPVELQACARADLDTLDPWLRGDYVRTLSDLSAFMPAQVCKIARDVRGACVWLQNLVQASAWPSQLCPDVIC